MEARSVLRVTLIVLLCFQVTIVFAATTGGDLLWDETYGYATDERAYSGIELNDGNILMTGYVATGTGTFNDVYLIKTTNEGVMIWEQTIGGGNNDYGRAVIEASTGGYIITGYTESFGAGGADVYLIKTDIYGEVVWEKTFGGGSWDRGYDVIELSDGGYLVTGQTGSFGAGDSDVYLIKTDADGNTVWTQTYGTIESEQGWEVIELSEGGYLVVGQANPFPGDVYLLKTDQNGDLIWGRTYGGPSYDWGYSVIETSQGSYLITGLKMGNENWDAFLINTNENGDILWQNTYGGVESVVGYSVIELENEGYLIAGTSDTYESPTGSDIYLGQTDIDGNLIWSTTYGGVADDYAHSVSELGNGGYLVTGYTDSVGAGSNDFYLLLIEAFVPDEVPETPGDSAANIGGTGGDFAESVIELSDGDFLFAGFTTFSPAQGYDVYLVKTDSNLNVKWEKNYGGIDEDRGYSVIETSDGSYLISGYTMSFGVGSPSVYLIKTNTDGEVLWTYTYGSESHWSYSVTEVSTGGYVITGYRTDDVNGYEVFLVGVDEDGTLLWEQTYGGTNDDAGEDVIETSDGGFAIVGSTYSFGAGSYDAYLIKTDSLGNIVWSTTFGGSYSDWGYSIIELDEGGYVIGGRKGVNGHDFYLVKTNANGALVWENTYGGTGSEYGYDLIEDSQGNYLLTGYTLSYGAGQHDIYVVKTDPYGNQLLELTYGETNRDEARAFTALSDGGLLVVGRTRSFGNGDYDAYLVKIDQSELYQIRSPSLSSTSGWPEDVIVVSGGLSEIVPDTSVEVYWSPIDSWNGESGLISSVTASSDGSYSLDISIPSVIAGDYVIWIKSVETGHTSPSDAFSLNPYPSIQLGARVEGEVVDGVYISVDGTWETTQFSVDLDPGWHRIAADGAIKIDSTIYTFSHWENQEGTNINTNRVYWRNIQESASLYAVYTQRTSTISLTILDDSELPLFEVAVTLDGEPVGLSDVNGELTIPGVLDGVHVFTVDDGAHRLRTKWVWVVRDRAVSLTLLDNPVVHIEAVIGETSTVCSVRVDDDWYSNPVDASLDVGWHRFTPTTRKWVGGEVYSFLHWADTEGNILSTRLWYWRKIVADETIVAIYG
jgi:hypothetical protein